ncbi:ABC transporter ATP-binding protein [bacterium]|nr:MAG: ABC transporter ATP-binding protein [bacterium]
MSCLEAAGVRKRFGGLHAVDGVDFTVEPGELVGLFGPNGAGKTTLFNLIAGAYYPDAGTIRFGGDDVTRFPAFRRARLGIARTFQVVRPFRALSIMENLLAVVASEGALSRTPEQDALQLLAGVGLADRANDPAGSLTLGMLKRFEVARALMVQPRLILLDEPLAGLTDGESAMMLRLIESVKVRAAVVMVEHNVRLALPLCDRAVVMEQGRVIAQGTPAQIRSDPAVIHAYLGDTPEGG